MQFCSEFPANEVQLHGTMLHGPVAALLEISSCPLMSLVVLDIVVYMRAVRCKCVSKGDFVFGYWTEDSEWYPPLYRRSWFAQKFYTHDPTLHG